MKQGIHPHYYRVDITCACGSKYLTKSTKTYKIDICSACHPFFTGKSKLIDTEGMIEKFNRKYKKI